ncbi:hypothetical protein B0H16DRAFT_1449748 [Mycena metata]|uniref:Uncharacterized protein n=1 Tax=Mycena metata TaxID=1033252 RepID=A0AAD7K3D0_9AGAR|nr:hypothetical protein B0H16DRAFT_1449748 [Mycena metata]
MTTTAHFKNNGVVAYCIARRWPESVEILDIPTMSYTLDLFDPFAASLDHGSWTPICTSESSSVANLTLSLSPYLKFSLAFNLKALDDYTEALGLSAALTAIVSLDLKGAIWTKADPGCSLDAGGIKYTAEIALAFFVEGKISILADPKYELWRAPAVILEQLPQAVNGHTTQSDGLDPSFDNAPLSDPSGTNGDDPLSSEGAAPTDFGSSPSNYNKSEGRSFINMPRRAPPPRLPPSTKAKRTQIQWGDLVLSISDTGKLSFTSPDGSNPWSILNGLVYLSADDTNPKALYASDDLISTGTGEVYMSDCTQYDLSPPIRPKRRLEVKLQRVLLAVAFSHFDRTNLHVLLLQNDTRPQCVNLEARTIRQHAIFKAQQGTTLLTGCSTYDNSLPIRRKLDLGQRNSKLTCDFGIWKRTGTVCNTTSPSQYIPGICEAPKRFTLCTNSTPPKSGSPTL